MKILDSIKEGIRSKMLNFLKIEPAQKFQIHIEEGMSEELKVIKNEIWYRGDAHELEQLYSQLPHKQDTFWGAVQSADLRIRRIHTGIPAIVVDTLAKIVIDNYNGIEFKDDDITIKEEWKTIEKENTFDEMLKDSIVSALNKGAGAFKFSFDFEISKYPIIEFFGKDRIEVVKKRNKVVEIVFKTNFNENKKQYQLKERYGLGYIIYELYDLESQKQVDLKKVKETEKLEGLKFAGAEIDKDGNVSKYGDFMLACLFKITEDAIYDKKTDDFDALDETWSQWMNAVRDGRVKTYIPDCLLPRNPKTGEISRKANPFDDKFIKTESNAGEKAENKIQTEQPEIKVDNYMISYINALDLALEGLISPATLGIDTKKITDPNAAAQREKEKITLQTRNEIIEALNNTLPNVVSIAFKAIDVRDKKTTIREVESNPKFGEYANPSFEAQVETCGKGREKGVMSVEAAVDEMYGDSKDEKWKAEEVKRIKAEEGIIDLDEPSVGNSNNFITS